MKTNITVSRSIELSSYLNVRCLIELGIRERITRIFCNELLSIRYKDKSL